MSNSRFNVKNLISETQLKQVEEESRFNYLNKIINEGKSINSFEPIKAVRISFFLFNTVLSKLENSELIGEIERKDLESVYYQLRAIDITNLDQAELFDEVWGIDGVEVSICYYFYLSTVGLVSNNNIKVRIDLFDFEPKDTLSDDWKLRVLNEALTAIILLIRKKDGLGDAGRVVELVNKLRQEQKNFEEQFLESIEVESRLNIAVELLGLYHLTKMLIETATYLVEGYNYKGNLQAELSRHSKYARDAFNTFPRLFLLVPLIEKVCLQIQRNSIWFNTINLSSSITKLCQRLADLDKIDLLPSQQQALSKNLLDAASNATIVTMPTSAGKTLLAEFCILQALALNNQIRIIYLVPTRALVNQVVSDLRTDFEGLNLIIEKTSKVNEVDPTENLFLQDDINILVSTPEKFDLLLRQKHSSVDKISFIVVDEAHNIQEGDRGAKLELLLAIIRREKPNAKFLLLSPFIPNANELKEWLAAGKNAISPIQVLWKPADKVIFGLVEKKKGFELVIRPSAHSFLNNNLEKILPVETDFKLLATSPKERLFETTARLFGGDKNSVLFLCYGKGTADKNANKLAQFVGTSTSSELKDLVSKFIKEEVGEETTLSKVIKKGIAVHHAGMTDDSKILVEYLIKRGEVKYICATTTIAQGINFPISTVYFDDTRKGNSGRLSTNEFLNIAGRAGRTMVDNVGKIVFPFNSKNNIQIAVDLISKEALNISSSLTKLILQAESIINVFKQTNNAAERAQLYDKNDSLGVLVQYLIHLLNISEEYKYKDELEELFKDSFGYFTLKGEQREKFLKICETLYLDLESRNKGVLKFADKTGFSVPSVLKIMEAKKENPDINSSDSWQADNLFNKNNLYLAKKIEVIAALRESKLGVEGNAPFNPELISDILKSWVNGESISKISTMHPHFSKMDDQDRINDFVKYLTDTTFKSSWGLSALENIVRSTNDDISENTHVSSLLFYGVKDKSAIPYRMLGIPRLLAGNFAEHFDHKEPKSFRQIRSNMEQLTLTDWDNLKPKKSKLSGLEWKTVTEVLLRYQ